RHSGAELSVVSPQQKRGRSLRTNSPKASAASVQLDRVVFHLLFRIVTVNGNNRTPMHRRRFLESTALTALSAALPSTTSLAFGSDALEPFEWATDDLTLAFEFSTGRLRQKQLLPKDVVSISKSSGVEVALQCSGENSPDQGMK